MPNAENIINDALESLVKQGMLKKLPDGRYKPTAKGREVVALEEALDEID